jgi:uncharacterized protein GlcG (DUF336 family)
MTSGVLLNGGLDSSTKETGFVIEQKTLGLSEAQTVIDAVMAECKRVGHPALAICVVDKQAELIAFVRMDGRSQRFGKAAHRKAYSAAVFERDTEGIITFWARQEAEGHRGPNDWGDPMLTTLPGGYVVRYNGEIVGALSVAGGASGDADTPPSDRYFAEIGVRSLGDGYTHTA